MRSPRMRSVFDPTSPPEQMTAESWEEQWLGAIAGWVLEQMEKGRIPPPGIHDA